MVKYSMAQYGKHRIAPAWPFSGLRRCKKRKKSKICPANMSRSASLYAECMKAARRDRGRQRGQRHPQPQPRPQEPHQHPRRRRPQPENSSPLDILKTCRAGQPKKESLR